MKVHDKFGLLFGIVGGDKTGDYSIFPAYRDVGTLANSESLLGQFIRVFHRHPHPEIYRSVYQTHDGSSSRNIVEDFGDRKLPSPVCLLISLPLIVLGGWLNSYGIDRAILKFALLGWCGIVAGGIPVAWFITVFLAHFLN
ncbi:MAG TPA: hypothetical protein VN911_03040 [Candidatus Acidoferrum sp.]|nr:hypothetical protein [Candidatus Acidoferrum sp.]